MTKLIFQILKHWMIKDLQNQDATLLRSEKIHNILNTCFHKSRFIYLPSKLPLPQKSLSQWSVSDRKETNKKIKKTECNEQPCLRKDFRCLLISLSAWRNSSICPIYPDHLFNHAMLLEHAEFWKIVWLSVSHKNFLIYYLISTWVVKQ